MKYDYYSNEEEDFINRYESFDGLQGIGLFRELVQRPEEHLLNRLKNEPHNQPADPTVFISHRQSDKSKALRAKAWAESRGFSVWLDILDPGLRSIQHLDNKKRGILTACIIEMALIHCTHVLAIYTLKSQGSGWIPYEYGRVSSHPERWSRAACYVKPSSLTIPEYMGLGVVAFTQQKVEDWLDGERAKFRAGAIN